MKTLSGLLQMKNSGEKISCLTAYDATFSYWMNEAEIDIILVGDSLGMVVQGHSTTIPVTLDDMIYHTKMVQRGNNNAWCITDLPFMSYYDINKGCESAARLMSEGNANMIKLEGGGNVIALVERLTSFGIPVCGHLGVLPQSVQKTNYKVLGKDSKSALKLKDEALELQKAGVDILLLECVPADLAFEITQSVDVPVIGIGSGKETDGQILVTYDMLGITVGHTPSFSKNFLQGQSSIQNAFKSYKTAVKERRFPE